MRRALIAAGLLCLGLSGTAQAAPSWQSHHLGAIDCKKTPYQSDKYVCGHAELLAQEREKSGLYEDLLKTFTGDDQRIFMTGEWSWRNKEQCFDARLEARYNKDHTRCLADKMAGRIAVLRALKADPTLLRKQAADYDFIDPWYLNKFAKQYDGKTINLEGFIEIANCEGPLSPVRARIKQDGSEAAAEFESLSNGQFWFYCEKGIGTWWDGVVRLDAQGQAVLHMTQK